MSYQFNNPFDGLDTDFYSDLLKKDAKPKQTIYLDNEDIQEAEVIGDDSNDILSRSTIKGLPPPIPKELKDNADEANKVRLKSNSKQVSETFSKLFKDLNEKYGLDVNLDFNSFSKSLEYTIQPKNKKALELYLSEAYGRFRVVLYGQYLNAVSLLSAQILDPAYLLSESLPYDGKLLVLKQLFEFMNSLNAIYKEVNIDDTDLKLKKLSDDDEEEFKISDPNVMEFLRLLSENVKSNDKDDKDE